MIRSVTMARFRRFAFALALSVARVCAAQSEAPASQPGPAFALLLPSQKTVFAQAAEAVRLGFFAAHEARGKGPQIQVLEVDDEPDQLYSALEGAQSRGVALVVGPLPRSAVNAVVDGGHAMLPMVALNYPERDGSAPPSLIAMGLSAEAEAHYVVRIALAEFLATRRVTGNAPRFVVLGGGGGLERRVAQAYVAALRAAGEPPLTIDTAIDPVGEWVRRLDPGRIEAVFLALDARAAALVRARIPRELLVFGTSLLNIGGTRGSPETVSLAHDLDGIRFVDMPWLVKPDGRTAADPAPPAPMPIEMARLFALGVDAYRLADRWSRGETRFTFEGMSGRLSVDRAAGPRVERTPASAIYRNGAIEREEVGR
jgi:outer membrane PBP1 activator LpoA protein